MDLGRLGIWTYQLNYQPASRVREVAAELEELGCGPCGLVSRSIVSR
jgi:hypothetical protein